MDENLSSAVADRFRNAGFRVLEVTKHPGLRGRDEREFIGELLRMNAVFVTGDAAFVEELEAKPRRHAGIVFIEQMASPLEKEWFSVTAAHGIIGRCADGHRAFHGRIAYVGVDGIRVIYSGRDTLAYSWPEIDRWGDPSTVERVRKSRRGKRGARTA